jgi:ATP adenylyltransferase
MAKVPRLWAPWRMRYIDPPKRARRGSRAKPARGKDACLFCRVASARDDRRDLVLARRDAALLMLNRYPYNPGHLMVALVRHHAEFEGLTAEEQRDLLDLIGLAERALAAEYRPHGVNYGANVGRVAGAGFPGHLHLHVVPRWNGDTNFMPIVGETKVLPESLDRTWRRLRGAIRAAARRTRGAPRGTRA